MSVIVLIPAAGTGSRMKAAVNKQYLMLVDRPVLARTIDLFEHHPRIDSIFVITPQAEIQFCRQEVVERFGFRKVRELIPGGAQRQDSVRNGIRACGAGPDDVILIHDGARPLLAPTAIDEIIDMVGETGAALVGVPAKDTLKEVVDGKVRMTPARDLYWQAQTPQAFRYSTIREAHEMALADGFRGTDDAMLVERLGKPVAMVMGSYRNIKITTPEDLALATALLVGSQGGEE